MEVLCGGCGKLLLVPDGAAGGRTRCPKCGRQIRLPELDARTAPSARPAPPGEDGEGELADEFLTRARLALKNKLLVDCPRCGERLTVAQHLAGQVTRCPACGGQVQIPSLDGYEGALEAEKILADAEGPAESLDIAELASAVGARREPAAEAAPIEAAGPPVVAAPSSRPAHRRPTNGRGVFAVALTAALAGVGGFLLGYWVGRRNPPLAEAPPRQVSAEVSEPSGPLRAGPARQTGPTSTPGARATASHPAEAPVPPTQPAQDRPKVTILNSRLTVLGGNGLVPAPLKKAFLGLRVQIVAADKDAEFETASGAVVLLTPKGSFRPEGIDAGGGDFPMAARHAKVAVPARARGVATFVFLVPEDLTSGELSVAGLGKASMPPLPAGHAPAAAAIVGTWDEARRRLKVSFDDPFQERLRNGPRQTIVIAEAPGAEAGKRFQVRMNPAGISGLARPAGRGTCQAALRWQAEFCGCWLRLAEDGNKLILYLSDKPYHQIIYERQ